MDGFAQVVHEGGRSGLADYRVTVLAHVLDSVPKAQFVNARPQLVGYIAGRHRRRGVCLHAIANGGFSSFHSRCLVERALILADESDHRLPAAMPKPAIGYTTRGA